MEKLFKQYMYHIDELRIESKMTIGYLCEDMSIGDNIQDI